MTKFTPQELLKVAQRVIPAPKKTSWRVRENRRVTLYGDTCGWSFDFSPETNHDQWRALAEFCAWKGIKIVGHKEYGFSFFTVLLGIESQAFETHAQAMIAAVLALEVSEDV